MSRRRWEPGCRLSALEALMWISLGQPIYYRHKWTHPGWALSWPIRTLIVAAQHGWITEARKIEEQK